MAGHRKHVCAWCSKALPSDEPLVSEGLRFHSEACYRAWDRLWGRLAVLAWIGGIIFIAVLVAVDST